MATNAAPHESDSPLHARVQPSRRTIVKGAAWAVPVIAATAVVPLAAASPTPPDRCDPPSLPTGTGWTVDGERLKPGGGSYVAYALGNTLGSNVYDGSREFIRVYADAEDNITGDARAWATASLGTLLATGVYQFTAEVRGQYATHANDRAFAPDPDHQNSFRTDVRGFVDNIAMGESIAVTALYSTRADVAPSGAVQIPNLNDDVDKRGMRIVDNVPWTQFPLFTFTVPAHWIGESVFRWEFTMANRNTRLVKHNPAASNPGDPDFIGTGTGTPNDDMDVTYPTFITAVCPPEEGDEG